KDTTSGPWPQLLELLELEPSHTMLPKSSQLLAWIETHEKAFEEGSLEHWIAYRIATCLEQELEDAEGVRTVAAQLQIPRKQNGRGDFCFLVANITTHRREIHTWIGQQSADAFAIQETHLLPQPMKEAQINYDRGKWSTNGIPAHDTGKGTSGGLLLGAKTHINMREGPRFSIQGKGFLFGVFRFPGYDIAIGTVYLESGVGPDSGLNPRILAELMTVIESFSCCWILAGDWNCSWDDLQQSSFPRLSQAGVVLPDQATTTQGSTLDYALCSRELVGLLVPTVTWDVPFRPHAGISYNLQVSGLGTPVLQSKVFTRGCLEQPRDLPRPPDPCRVSFLLEEASSHPRDTSWGGFVRWLEATTCEDGEQGRAWRVEAEFKPLVRPTSPDYPWMGRKHGFWSRLALWVSQAAMNKLNTRVIPAVLRHLEQEDQDLELEGIDVPALRSCLYEAIKAGAVPSQTLLDDLKKATTARPYRDLPLEIRPHARRAAWMHLWQPTSTVRLGNEDAFLTLKQQAIKQFRDLGPLAPSELAKVIKKLAPKVPGLDGLTAMMLKQASTPQLQELADHIAAWESSGAMPGPVLTTGVAMLPKKPERERPIGLTSFGYRLWARARWPLYEKWAEQYSDAAPWDGAKKGMASLDIALTRLVRGEIQHHLKKQGTTLLLDLREFYEHVGLLQLVLQAQQHDFPPLILHHCLSLYTHSRYICTEETLSAPVKPTRGIIAGCPYAPGLSKLVMHPVMSELWADPNLDHCDLYIDDSSFDIEGKSTTEVVHKSLKVWRHVKQAFQAQHLPISIGKSAWVCSSRAMEKKLAEHLGPEDPKIQSCWRDLGIDSAGGKRRRACKSGSRATESLGGSRQPLGATLCYAKDMGWTALSLTQWRIDGELWCVEDPVQLEKVVKLIHRHWARKRSDAVSGLEASAALKAGVDWTVGKKILKSTCYDCKWWQENHPVPAAVQTALSQLPTCVKVRGLPPVSPTSPNPRDIKLTGLWKQATKLDDPQLKFATDGSPGCTGDPRCWRMTWAAIAFVCREGSIEVLATATGPVPGDQTVFRAEAMALLFIAEHTTGDVDITMDAKSVKTRVERRSLGKTSLDLFTPLREQSDRLHLRWIRSHRSPEQHCQEFGAETKWRWLANGVVDKLAGDEANGARDLAFEAQLQALDKATHRVQGFLAERVALLFGYDKDQGPQVTFDGESVPASKQARPSGLCRKKRNPTSQESQPKPPPEHSDNPNKRDLLRAVVSNPPLGHQWIWTSEHQ
ncbi:unnamed protein product, partial [Symbiodinium necroappetens]